MENMKVWKYSVTNNSLYANLIFKNSEGLGLGLGSYSYFGTKKIYLRELTKEESYDVWSLPLTSEVRSKITNEVNKLTCTKLWRIVHGGLGSDVL